VLLNKNLRHTNQYAEAIRDYKGDWVPKTILGGSGAGSGGALNGAQALIDLLTVKTAQDLNLDMSVPKGSQVNQ
jgi:hypothetical protein